VERVCPHETMSIMGCPQQPHYFQVLPGAHVTSGVPQGSVLGPLLFVMLVNDIPSIVLSPIFMFADDIKIFCFDKSSDDHTALQNNLNSLYEWSVHWQLKFNISKCTLGHPIAMDHIL